jgi:hypothetical protein
MALLDDLEDKIKNKIIKERYLNTILRCVTFDICLAIFTGLACAVNGTLIFVTDGYGSTATVVALVVHYLFDAAILAHNIFSRFPERSAEYAFNLTRVVFWFSNNLVFAVLIGGLWEFIPNNKENFVIIIYMWMLNSIIAVGITASFAFLEGRRLRPGLL